MLKKTTPKNWNKRKKPAVMLSFKKCARNEIVMLFEFGWLDKDIRLTKVPKMSLKNKYVKSFDLSRLKQCPVLFLLKVFRLVFVGGRQIGYKRPENTSFYSKTKSIDFSNKYSPDFVFKNVVYNARFFSCLKKLKRMSPLNKKKIFVLIKTWTQNKIKNKKVSLRCPLTHTAQVPE